MEPRTESSGAATNSAPRTPAGACTWTCTCKYDDHAQLRAWEVQHKRAAKLREAGQLGMGNEADAAAT